MNSAALGMIVALAIGTFAIHMTTDDVGTYINIVGLVIVVGGTVSTSVISYNIVDLYRMYVKIIKVFRKSPINPTVTVKQIVALSRHTSAGVALSSQKAREAGMHPFIQDGIRYIENGFSAEGIEEIMTRSIIERKEEYLREIDVISTSGKYPPAFGMMGTVIGLVALLYGLGDASTTEQIGPNMAIALITTLYGLVLANYIFQPIADNLVDRMRREMHVRRIILAGILLLQRQEDSVLVQETLNSYLLPSQRLTEDDVTHLDEHRGRRAA